MTDSNKAKVDNEKLIGSDAIDFVPADVGEMDLYKRREKIYTRTMQGFFQRLRQYTGWPLLIGYFAVPWLMWGDHQAMLFDLPQRQFHIFFLTFMPQQFPYLAGLLIMGAYALFTVTNFAGRVWCGYTCPQTVWTAMFMWIEQYTEGSRIQRMKLDKQPWSVAKLFKKASKHIMWLGVAFMTGFTFVSYFSPARSLLPDVVTGQAPLMAYAWIVFFTITTYLNAGWMREQVCMYMCPYARFQSAMFDKDTLIISYDEKRGESRGARKRHQAKPDNLGDCIDCELCVQVCPTGIDIRNGLQYECIGCALCIDACDSVMDKMGYDRGLVRYTTENILAGGESRIFRPRLLAYGGILVLVFCAWSWSLLHRESIELDVIRDRNHLYTQTEEGFIENVYTLNFVNFETSSITVNIAVEGLPNYQLSGPKTVTLQASEVLSVPVRLLASPEGLSPISDIKFALSNSDGINILEDSRFITPVKRPAQ